MLYKIKWYRNKNTLKYPYPTGTQKCENPNYRYLKGVKKDYTSPTLVYSWWDMRKHIITRHGWPCHSLTTMSGDGHVSSCHGLEHAPTPTSLILAGWWPGFPTPHLRYLVHIICWEELLLQECLQWQQAIRFHYETWPLEHHNSCEWFWCMREFVFIPDQVNKAWQFHTADRETDWWLCVCWVLEPPDRSKWMASHLSKLYYGSHFK